MEKEKLFIPKAYESPQGLPNSKQIIQSRDSLTCLKNKQQYYVKIEHEMVNVFLFYLLANKSFMEKEQIKSLFFKTVDPKNHTEINNICKNSLEFSRQIEIGKVNLIDRLKIIFDSIKSNFPRLSTSKQFCSNQKMIKQLYALYPKTTFKLKPQKQVKNATSYIRAFQIKDTNRVILAFFQEGSQPKDKLQQNSSSYSFYSQNYSSSIVQNPTEIQINSPRQIKPIKKELPNKQDRKKVDKSQIQEPKQPIKLPQLKKQQNVNQLFIIAILSIILIFCILCLLNRFKLVQEISHYNFLRFPQIAATVDNYKVTQIFWSFIPEWLAKPIKP